MTKNDYRRAVMAIILCGYKALIIEKKDVGWQFLQGGIESCETPKEALIRELKEEISIDLSSISSIKETDMIRKYDWPEDLQKKYKKKGQEQILFIVELYDQDINLAEDILIDYKWLPFKEAVEMLSFDDLKDFALIAYSRYIKK